MENEVMERRPTRSDLEVELLFAARNPLVYEAMRAVDRANFVPEDKEESAYEDEVIPNGEGSTISQPTLVAEMIDHLRLKGNEKVLEIGTGSGFEAAVLSFCSHEVYTVDITDRICSEARARFEKVGIRNVYTFVSDGALGLPEYGPYDRIIVSAQFRQIPSELENQLKEGGIIVAPVGKDPDICKLLVGIKEKGNIIYRVVSKKVWFVKVLSEVRGAWTKELLDKSRMIKRRVLRDELTAEGEGKLEEFFDQMRKVLTEKGVEVPESEDELLDIVSNAYALPDDSYKEID